MVRLQELRLIYKHTVYAGLSIASFSLSFIWIGRRKRSVTSVNTVLRRCENRRTMESHGDLC